MNLAEAIFASAGGMATVLTVIGTYTWWVYRRGEESGKSRAERDANQRAQVEEAAEIRTLQTQLAAIQAELDSLRPKRRRA
jgi:type VI protein secretion system component VasK